ncbi:glycosyltransferase [Bradyrhizobium valentinum]|uniref:glycosyltransferase n=1 Tax=Bradyrhizobium valentinum TaxID=1518501 RepID=UPI000A8F13F7|nr:glycosyltransferase [Bradyrhizobium valentinum]
MRVMFVLNCLGTGGAERHTYQLANALAAHGDICTIVGLTSSYSTVDLSQLSIKTAHLSQSSIKKAHLSQSSVEMLDGNRIYDIGTAFSVSRMIRTHAPEVIVAADERPLLFATISRRLAGSNAKLVSILHNPDIQTARERVFHPIYRYVVARVDAMIYVAQDQRKLWEDRGYSPPTSIIIRNGVDLRRFSTHSITEWRDRTRSMLGFGPGDYVIGLCAHFRPQKNHRQLIDAIRILRSRGHPAKALLVGSGPTQASIEQYASENGVLEHIVFAGLQQDVRPYTSAFDVGVLCSITEAASLVALEMMAMGLPVILSNVGNAAEMVLPGETGFLFPTGDTISLVNFLETLSDPLKRETIGRAASQFVAANFDADRMLYNYRDFLTGLLVENRRCDL